MFRNTSVAGIIQGIVCSARGRCDIHAFHDVVARSGTLSQARAEGQATIGGTVAGRWGTVPATVSGTPRRIARSHAEAGSFTSS
jgi:hypothetical protein